MHAGMPPPSERRRQCPRPSVRVAACASVAAHGISASRVVTQPTAYPHGRNEDTRNGVRWENVTVALQTYGASLTVNVDNARPTKAWKSGTFASANAAAHPGICSTIRRKMMCKRRGDNGPVSSRRWPCPRRRVFLAASSDAGGHWTVAQVRPPERGRDQQHCAAYRLRGGSKAAARLVSMLPPRSGLRQGETDIRPASIEQDNNECTVMIRPQISTNHRSSVVRP